jgi:ABC-2 type transport system permease protein
MTGEYSSGSIRATLAAIPRRPLALAAKAAVFGAVALVAGEIVVFATYFVGPAALTDEIAMPGLGDPGVLRALGLSGVYLAQVGLIGLGLGAVIRHTASAIGAFVSMIYVLPAILGGLTGVTIAKFFPTMIAGNSIAVVKPDPAVLSPWTGFALLCAYTAIALATGGWLLARRDA